MISHRQTLIPKRMSLSNKGVSLRRSGRLSLGVQDKTLQKRKMQMSPTRQISKTLSSSKLKVVEKRLIRALVKPRPHIRPPLACSYTLLPVLIQMRHHPMPTSSTLSARSTLSRHPRILPWPDVVRLATCWTQQKFIRSLWVCLMNLRISGRRTMPARVFLKKGSLLSTSWRGRLKSWRKMVKPRAHSAFEEIQLVWVECMIEILIVY